MTITFIGHGYVGLVTAAVFADFGNTVYVIGHTQEKIDDLKKGITPFYEPGLTELVKKNIKAKRLLFTLDYNPAIPDSDAVFIAVGTPTTKTGDANLKTVLSVAEKIAKHLSGYTVVATKSTVPSGTNRKVSRIIQENKPQGAEFDYASIPEFLREGSAISDTLHPDRVVIGTKSDRAKKLLVDLHKPVDAPVVSTDFDTAELIKYAANSFLAMKISYANAIAKLSELVGADGIKVLEGIGMDNRIGDKFLAPGPGYGGSCFPKDVRALITIAKDFDYDFGLLNQTEQVNSQAKRDIVKKVRHALGDVRGKRIGVLGLAFKANTDDMRDAPAIDILELLKNDGAIISAYDPEARETAAKVISDITFAKSAKEALTDADAMLVLTEWNEFKDLELKQVKKWLNSPLIVDARNLYNPEEARELGFNYIGVGR